MVIVNEPAVYYSYTSFGTYYIDSVDVYAVLIEFGSSHFTRLKPFMG